MALFNNTYSGLITKGLGMPACCGLLTMGFTLFKCTINVIPIPPTPGGGGGGGSYAIHPNVYQPFNRSRASRRRRLEIVVRVNDQHTWRRSYDVTMQAAGFVVRAMNIVNAATSKLSVTVNGLKRVTRQVFARFRSSDK